MTKRSVAASLGEGIVGIGIGFALYMLISNFGLGGKGSASGGSQTSAPKTPPRARDQQPMEILVRPPAGDPKKAVIELEGRVISPGDLVARISAGGRRDVRVTVTGDTVQGAWDALRDALAFAGIQVLRRSSLGVPINVSGNARGQYGQGRR